MDAKDIALMKKLGGGGSGSGSGGSVVVDSGLSDTSTNPVQNKVIKAALDAKLAKSGIKGKTDAMTQAVGVDAGGALWTEPGGGGGSGKTLALIAELTLSEEAHFEITNDIDGNLISETELIITSFIPAASANRDIHMQIKREDGGWTNASASAFKVNTNDFYRNNHIIATGDYLLVESNQTTNPSYNASMSSYKRMVAHQGPICGVRSTYNLPTVGSIIKLYAWR